MAQLLRGEAATDMLSDLAEHLGQSFRETIGWCTFDAPLSKDAGVQRAIDDLSSMMRAHDEAV